ncbi:MAG: STAS domain-containing protein [Bacteroidetes bacterium]|nr:MAG: STAS domain-containing protein [Bacteroidota bacterium]
MNFKIDTKDKFHVITVAGPILSAVMAEQLSKDLASILNTSNKNIILSLKEVQETDVQAGELLVQLQQKFYDQNASFVICEIGKEVEELLDGKNLLELINSTPTESEAWDIVQMEEIEREFLDNDGL